MLTSAILEAWTSEFALATVTNRNVKQPIISLSETPYAALDIANDNPRSLEEELLARLAAAQRELSLVSMHLTANFREGTMRQIRQLLVPEFWDEEDAHLNMVSPRHSRMCATLLEV